MKVFVLLNLLAVGQAAERLCCRYRCDAQNECASWCDSNLTCTIRNGSQFVSDEGCSVTYDSKKDHPETETGSVESKQECLKKNFKSRRKFEDLPFYLQPYLYQEGLGHPLFTGIDLRYQYNAFNKLRFRFKNQNVNVCPEHSNLDKGSPCNPRCVDVDKRNSVPVPGLIENMAFLSYDCEAGFIIKSETNYIDTAGDDYVLGVCVEDDTESPVLLCGEYTFQMPAPARLNISSDHTVIILTDKQEFENRDKIIIYVPTTQKADSFFISLLLVSENKSVSEVYSQTEKIPHGLGKMLRIEIDHNIPSGRYQVAVTPMRGGAVFGSPSFSAYLTRPNYGEHALVIITAILTIIITVGLILGVYKRWQQVAEEAAIEPSMLVEAGRMEPKPIMVITSLEDNDHAQIVKDLCSYLKDWCGVGEAYYPLDDSTGIHCGQRDPWKWAQTAYEKVKEKQGSLVFVAGPNPAISPSTSLYPGIQENQAFLATQDMRALAQQGRVLVVRLPYSDLKTLPIEVPAHLANSALLLPKHMNSFLSQLLQVKKKTLCNLIPVSLVQPDILPRDMTRTGGEDLLTKIRQLSIKEHTYRLDQAALGHNTVIDRLLKSPTEEGGKGAVKPRRKEEKGASQEKENLIKDKSVVMDTAEEGRPVLDITLEAGMPSVRTLPADRDKEVIDEL